MFRNILSLNFLSKYISRLRLSNMFHDFVTLSKCYSTNCTNSHYAVLGVKPEATDEEIKQAYYSLSKKYHPDLNFGNKSAESKILQINAAFEVLGNKAMKEEYDNKMFPKAWEKNTFIYDLDEREKREVPNYTYRRVSKHFSHTPDQYYKHVEGVKKRKHRHSVQKLLFNKSQSSIKFTKTFFK